MRKLATTVYGLVGTDWIRVTLAKLESSAIVFVRADGSNAILPTLPTLFRTSADMANVAAQLGHKVDFSAVPKVALKNHEWKGSMTLAELAEHKYQGPAIKANMAGLLASYADDIAVAA